MPSIRTISTSGSIPSITQLALGDLAVNTHDGKAYIKKQQGNVQTVLEIGSGAGGGVTQIIAGTNITISPVGGTGAVTINASSTTVSASYALSSSYSNTSVSASYALSASYAATSSYSTTASDILVYVKNQSGNTIDKGMVVRITGSNNSSDIPRVVTASYTSDNNSANTLGIAYENITNGSEGYVITEGRLLGIDTTNYISGQLIFLGATGSITGSAPLAPLHTVRLGEVIRHQTNNGSIYVRIDNGYELGELHDVLDTTTTGSYGDLLVKSGSVWTNLKALTGSYSITGSLTISGSSTFTNIGPAIFSGSVTGISGFTGSFSGSATSALTASYVLPLTQSVIIKGTGTTSATTALLVQNANASSSLQVRDDGSTLFAGSNGSTGTYIDTNGTLSIYRSTFGTTYGLRVWNGAGWSGHDAILGLSYRYPIYGAQGGNGSEQASPLSAGAGVLGKGGVGVIGQGVTPSGDTGSIGVMATTLFVNPTLTTSQYNRLAAAQIKGIGTSNSGSALTVRNGSDLPIITALDNRFVGIGTFSPSASLDVVGNVNISSSAGSGSALTVYKSGSTVVSIQGSQGELFSITDSLSGSLFSVSNISGLPILEVFSDNTVIAGSYINPGLTVTGSRVIATGSFSGSFTGSFSGTSSYSNNALSSSYSLSSSFAVSSSRAVSSSYATTANYAASTPTVVSTLFTQGYLLANQSIPNNTDTIIDFERQFDPNLWLDVGTRRFIPTVAGYYSVSFGAWLENPASPTNQVNVQIRKSTGGGPTSTVMILQQPLNNGTGISLAGTRIFYMDGATDYLDFTIFQGSGGAKNLLYGGTADGAGTWFSAHLLTM